MSRRKDSSDRDPAADRRDPVLRLAVAATALGMTMGIAPATVLGAGETEAAAPAAAATTDGAARKPDAVHLKITRRGSPLARSRSRTLRSTRTPGPMRAA